MASLLGFPRVGFVVPRYRHSAVERNRLKRRLRELVRIELLHRLPSSDVVLRVIPAAYDRDFAALEREMRLLAVQLGRVALPTSHGRPAGDREPGGGTGSPT